MAAGQAARPNRAQTMRRLSILLLLPALAGGGAALLARSGTFEHGAVRDLAPLLFFVAMPLLWLWICWGVAYAGGWHDLAKAYPLRGELPVAHQWKFQSIQMGLATYRNAVHVAADSRGICFRPMALFRAGNPPICVPWADITASDTKVLWLPMVRLRFDRVPQHSILIRKSLADKIRAAFADLWRLG
ncbi:MAG TPA: hypothetical protein VGT00_16980 [Methylomirabilota bacterium]|nr:hypothetical protein [Methylomirabilota bacterium]